MVKLFEVESNAPKAVRKKNCIKSLKCLKINHSLKYTDVISLRVSDFSVKTLEKEVVPTPRPSNH